MTQLNQRIKILSSSTPQGQERLAEYGNVWLVVYADVHGNKPSLLAESLSKDIPAPYMRWWSLEEITYVSLED